MDGERFDAWTRLLANRIPRRRAVKVLAGVGTAGMITRAATQHAAACLEDGQYCENNDECCNVCITFNCAPCLGKGEGHCDGPHDCCNGQMDCVDGKCTKKKKQETKCEGRGCRRKKHHHH
jgi:hypothetical protein